MAIISKIIFYKPGFFNSKQTVLYQKDEQDEYVALPLCKKG